MRTNEKEREKEKRSKESKNERKKKNKKEIQNNLKNVLRIRTFHVIILKRFNIKCIYKGGLYIKEEQNPKDAHPIQFILINPVKKLSELEANYMNYHLDKHQFSDSRFDFKICNFSLKS